MRKGSFGYRTRGRHYDLVAGSVLVGRAGDDYVCSHDHVCGDECLSLQLAPELVETIGDADAIWSVGALPPVPELMVLAELADAAAAAAQRDRVGRGRPADGGALRRGRRRGQRRQVRDV